MHVIENEERQMRSQEAWATDSHILAAALEGPRVGLVIFDSNLRVVHTNSKLREILGIDQDVSFRQVPLSQLICSATLLDATSSEWLKAACERTVSCTEDGDLTKCLTVGNGARTLAVENRRIGTRHWIATFEDITVRREQELRASEAALRDSLTGLANRRHFEQVLKDALCHRSEVSSTVFFVDLDRFKAVNDTLGHAIGDEVLRLVSQRLQSVVRTGDLIARLGGDEFAILATPAVSNEEAAGIATRFVDLLQRTYLVAGHVVNIGASVGIASAPKDGTDRDNLLQAADLALYHSKASGRGTFHFFDPSMQVRAQERRNLELDLRKALALRQFELHYLPRIDIATGEVQGLEALLRWRHPKKGLLLPDAFLPVAAEIGLTVPIGDWLLRTACRQATRLGSGLVMIVSALRQQFEGGGLAESVSRSLATAALEGSKLEIQITEDVLLRNKKMVLETLHQLRELRVRVAMDDFGTGYASITQLASFPFDRIKIGQSLVSEEFNNSNRAIVRAVAALGASLGIATTASGVETPEQLAKLHLEGCESVKGYLASQIVPPKDFDTFIAEISSAQPQLTSVA